MGNQIVKEKLYRQICKGDIQLVSKILDKYPKFLNEQLNQDEMCTPLILSIKKQNIQMTELLLEKGADPTLPNRKGITPFMVCAIRNNVLAYEMMFSNGPPDFQEKSNEGLRAIDYAVLYGHYEFARRLFNLSSSELQKPQFYAEIQKRCNSGYVNFGVFILHLEKNLSIQALPEVFQPVKPKIKDPVIDPRQSWKDFLKRVGNFENPPMISRHDLPDELKPENRSFLSRLRTRIQLGKSEMPDKECKSSINLEMASGTQAQIGNHEARQVVHA